MKKKTCCLLSVLLAFCMAITMFAGISFAEEAQAEEETEQELVFEGPGIIDVMDYPEEYKEEAEHQGRVERIDYNNGVGNKYMYVYLPYGYDDSDASYNVYYLMHGGNARPDIFLQTDHLVATQKLLDNAFEDGAIEPFILVASSWNPATDDEGNEIETGSSSDLTTAYVDELVNYIIPLIDGTYRTYAEGTDEESLVAAREHRAFGGFSMGGVTTWNVFMNAMRYFKYFVPESGDCWAVEDTGGNEHADETAQALADSVTAQGYTSDDFVIYAFTGSEDIALPNLGPQILAMQENDMFKFGENCFFGVLEGAEHSEVGGRRYRYTAWNYLWK